MSHSPIAHIHCLEYRYTARALAFIAASTAASQSNHNNKKHFALYYAFDHVHTPQFGTCDPSIHTDTAHCIPSPRGPFGDALLQVDDAVGAVLNAVRQLPSASASPAEAAAGAGRSKGAGTFAILTSDNGAPSGGSVIAGLNAPFTGTVLQQTALAYHSLMLLLPLLGSF